MQVNHCIVLSVPSVGMYGMQRCIYSVNYTVYVVMLTPSWYKQRNLFLHTINRLWKLLGSQQDYK